MEIDTKKIQTEHNEFWQVDHFTYDGLKQWINGCSFPKKTYCPPEVMFGLNQVKRVVAEAIKYPLIFIYNKQKLLDSFNDISYKIIGNYMNYGFIANTDHYEYLSEVAQELQDITYTLLICIGFTDNSALRFSKIFSNFIEYDDAYRFRVMDMFDCATQEQFVKSPIRTIDLVLKKVVERDSPGVSIKFVRLARILKFALFIPKYRKAFIKAMEESNYDKLKTDEIDWFWCCYREDYKYGGLSNEERKEYMKNKGWHTPPTMKLVDNKLV